MKRIKIKVPRITRKSLIIISILIILALVASVYLFQSKNKYEIEKVTEKVSKLIILPENEQPALFVIEDPAKLVPQQTFFKGAEKGDVLLVYKGSAKAVLYGFDRNIIVNSGPVDFGPIPSNKP